MIPEEELVTILKDLKDKVDLMQRDQALIRPDIVEHVYRILKKRWSDEDIRRRERI